MSKLLLLFVIISVLYSFNITYLNITANKNNQTYYNFTWTTVDYCEIKDFTGDTYTGWCYTGWNWDILFFPSKVFSWDTIYLTGERITKGIIYNWQYWEFGDACYSWDNIQGDLIDCWVN